MVSYLHALQDTLRVGLLPASLPLARLLSLPHLPDHFGTVASSALFFWAVQLVSPYVAPLVSRSYATLPKRTQHEWHVRVVSVAHVLVMLPMIRESLGKDALNRDRAFGWDEAVGSLGSVANGYVYFLWDTFESILGKGDIGFIIHGIASLATFTPLYRPFIAYYAPRALLFELSTPFLNIHWFLDKTGRTGGILQRVNGVLLLGTFFAVRLCYGAYISYQLFQTLFDVRGQVSSIGLISVGLGNITLNLLNWFWFVKMVAALKKRFAGKRKKSE
ncbi:hypothetical protein BOTBODRAFT_150707 [Botryobasidium botryosum FD-172 SS1]|uniref:TLC domain-containing protein n=1 Tax=Botryobasidium botryosum (strain FD-172 SS1) TaxID=930990 RepID=A0A067N175_BOTB1|nr:hypothetical protein BOTBODRAFT_150707 [Botryobasidium botryosum FD-172 SS1]